MGNVVQAMGIAIESMDVERVRTFSICGTTLHLVLILTLESVFDFYLAPCSALCKQLTNTMDNFEKQFEALDIQSSVMEKSVRATTAMSTPEEDVELLMRQV